MPMKRLLAPYLFFAALTATAFAQKPHPIFPDAAPVCAPEDLRKVSIPNTTIESVAVDPADGACHVTAIVTHPPATDRVKVWVALPMKNWNGRFRGNGGGGFVTGSLNSLRGPVTEGYATAATDGGHEGGNGDFALNASGRLNWTEIRDFAYLGIHDMTVVGKALTQAFYGKAPRYAYFVGGSTGGRQGLMEAQRFPDDYDGIFCGYPAVYWGQIVSLGMWSQVIMAEAKNVVSKAKLEAVTAAAVAACDGADGVVDGVIDDPIHCTWDPKAFVGTKVGDEVFTESDAHVVRQLWNGVQDHDGIPLWYGTVRGANLFALAGSEGTPLVGKPFNVSHDWVKFFLAQNPKWDWTTLTHDELELFSRQSVEQFGPTFSADSPDLQRFRDHGGKMLMLHGLADQLIPPQGSIKYYESVQRTMGGAARTADFVRLFLAPGIDHGLRGAGPSPVGQLAALLAWVEEAKAPDQLLAESRDKAGKLLRSRPLFPYPQFAKYSGQGSTDDAANFVAMSPK